jgi:hypothetical protein
MNSYRITYWDHDQKDEQHPRGRRVEVGTQLARNGIESIYSLLRAKGVDEADLDQADHVGSIKRLHLFGITFEATKI